MSGSTGSAGTDDVTGDEIAVVGLAGRFPSAADVSQLWRNLLDGVDAVQVHTDDELRALGLTERLIADPSLVRGAGRLDGVAEFDAGYFGVPEADAALLDPQHRLFLEQAAIALDDAGQRSDPAGHEVVGVFTGCSPNRYFLFQLLGNPAVCGDAADHTVDDRERQLVAGAGPDYLPAQVAYRLGFTGPAIAVQTACSSSLVAVFLAAQSLLDYRCDLALAGGVSITEPRFRHQAGGLVSPDGRCRAFDAAGQGSGYGSGVAVLALRRLADALAGGDRIHAVLRGGAVTNDGAARAGFAVPGADGQAAAVTEALASAGLTGPEIGLVEAHGSGTLLGDALEITALNRAFGPDARCALGSIKTNLGNLDAAAGAAGLIKAVLAVRDGLIPASLHFDTPNPQVDFGGFEVPVKTVEWPPSAAPRRAGVSSFGLGGTNAHVIVEQPPAVTPRGTAPEWSVLALSAAGPAALADLVRGLRNHLAAGPSNSWVLADTAYTLAARRVHDHRLAVLARSIPEALTALGQLEVAGGQGAGAATGPDSEVAPPPLRARAAAWLAGEPVDWTPLYHGGEHRRVWLPPYPFQRNRYWIAAP